MPGATWPWAMLDCSAQTPGAVCSLQEVSTDPRLLEALFFKKRVLLIFFFLILATNLKKILIP